MNEIQVPKSPGTNVSGTSNSSNNIPSNPVFASEVARAVCGYLSSVGCDSSRSAFIAEHPDLKDFSALVQKY